MRRQLPFLLLFLIVGVSESTRQLEAVISSSANDFHDAASRPRTFPEPPNEEGGITSPKHEGIDAATDKDETLDEKLIDSETYSHFIIPNNTSVAMTTNALNDERKEKRSEVGMREHEHGEESLELNVRVTEKISDEALHKISVGDAAVRSSLINTNSSDETPNKTETPSRIFPLSSVDTTNSNSEIEISLDTATRVIIESFEARGDTEPFDSSENVEYLDSEDTTEVSYHNYSASASSSNVGGGTLVVYSTMSWLDAFMYQHRGSLWILFNTFFMVIWILIGALSLYRLLGLPWCSPYVSRTQYLVIHLLIFTAATFEFVQLIHLSYGSHEGLPLFLTLLLTHTPTPCLVVSLIIITYCIFVSTRVPVFGSYLPPLLYIGILSTLIMVLSFVGDIIVGVSRNSAFLIVIRVILTGLCLACLLTYIFNYKRIVGVALLMRREFRGELKSLAIPVESLEENQDAKLHLKKILLTWSRITLASCVSGVLMCVFSFCLSLFFTVSFVPLWAFWVLHSFIFLSQIMVVISLTFGAAFTLSYSDRGNIFYKYFFPSYLNGNPSNGSFIKRGNFIYQRVSVVNGPTIPQVAPSTIAENEEQIPLRNNNIITELSTPPYRTKINLRRSATFNCSPPYGFHGMTPQCSSNLYPVLSDHILPYSNTQMHPDLNGTDVNDITCSESYQKPSLQLSNSFSHTGAERRAQPHNYGRMYPMRSFHGQDRFSSLSSVSNGAHRRSVSSQPPTINPTESIRSTSPGLAGTVEALEVRNQPSNVIPDNTNDFNSNRNFLRQIPHNHSFSNADKHRLRYEPPEKPARRAEPVLVKSVIKDNVNALPIQGAIEPDTKHYYSPPDPNLFPSGSNLNSFNKSHLFSANTPPLVNSSPGNESGFGHIPITKSSFNSHTSTVCHNSSPKFKERTSPLFYPKIPIRSNVGTAFSNSSEGSTGYNPKTNVNLTISEEQMEHPNKPNHVGNPPDLPDAKTDDEIGCGDRPTDDSPSFSNPDLTSSSFDSSTTFPASKKHSLKRNHSTAGDFSPHEKTTADKGGGESSSLQGLSREEVNGLKYPWYGTWGGRKKSKKRDSNSEMSSFNLRRLSTSKSSLSSLYERLKTKRSKSMYQQTQANNDGGEFSVMNEGEKDKEGQSSDINFTPQEEEEEEEFLPRLDEDIDLASEILKSSTVLADFYSLKRSDLKKRKKVKRGEEEEEVGGELEDADRGGEGNEGMGSGTLIKGGNDDESKKSFEVHNTDNT